MKRYEYCEAANLAANWYLKKLKLMIEYGRQEKISDDIIKTYLINSWPVYQDKLKNILEGTCTDDELKELTKLENAKLLNIYPILLPNNISVKF